MKEQSEIRFSNDIGEDENSKINFNKPNSSCTERTVSIVYLCITYLRERLKSLVNGLKGKCCGSIS